MWEKREKHILLKVASAHPIINVGKLLGYGIAYVALQVLYAYLTEEVIKKHPEKKKWVLIGPAYKGIPLASLVNPLLASKYELYDLYPRKESKTHGEGGEFMGFVDFKHNPEEYGYIIIDDVITDGGAKLWSIDMIRKFLGVEIKPDAILVLVDREEEKSKELEGIDILSAFNTPEIIEYAKEEGLLPPDKYDRVKKYLDENRAEAPNQNSS